MVFSLRGGVPLDLFVFLGRKGNPRSEQGFPFLPKTHLPFLALLRGVPLRTPRAVDGEGVLSPMFLCAFAVQTRAGYVTAPRAGQYLCTERAAPTHSLGWDIHTRPSGTHPLARVGHTHQPEWYLHTKVV